MSLDDKYMRWRCCECDWLHESEEDAVECCQPRVQEGWACPVCEQFHEDEEDAIACCDYEEDKPREPSSLELEAMGQERLFK
jgi:hypothetical protein